MSKKIKVLSVFGTRPEAIKMVPLVQEMKKEADIFESCVVVTAQHREMLDQVLTAFEIIPDYDLDIMRPNQSLAEITSRVLLKLDEIMRQEKPDMVLVHGDTTTAYAASLSAFYHQIRVGHVEAGLRTWQKYSPFPEEINRQLIDVIADDYFAPTSLAREHLLAEGKNADHIFVTGNTVIDALQYTVKKDYHHEVLSSIDDNQRIILVTMHRRENLGEPMRDVFTALKEIVLETPDVELIYPMHLNPKVREAAGDVLGDVERVHLIEPLEVLDFHNLASRSYLILTDSGGIQEEAPSLNKPVLVLRDTTERPEGVEAGTLHLVGTDYHAVKKATKELLEDKGRYKMMSEAPNPYGDGIASQRILQAIAYAFDKAPRPADFK
ncbi:UDP-N-acetylglucosamine 2-epimerase (non-hydrolyzing) [Vagococcus lutrae]|uniref:non-hydrolyzing UDP-N-acetylglucosamine 2-epimerase n=1 Tax=Vagococcus lutrae TaxID=81947 RepID=UPI0028928EF3|nr:UDP-N-acetylglucosamine 2-epimerase (non-hydrolyzing) [Vagococcus lutrae]MDT2802016.1 UDP-N-acetylglucosamine 2-epimerase (non-hydrolyzing) [Vagococcus lutrae]MDT2826206.1 UDP-N-acetylglucosamine 2-epimerase (non-hydrolyzing) [Vagococcus lutrae]